jgi:ribosomal protein L37E
MPWHAGLRSIRWWGARVIFALLVVFTALLAWLWVSAALSKPYRFYHSTSRYCSYIGFVNGRFVIHYDGGDDQGIVTQRDWKFMGVFWKGDGGPAVWQHLDIGLDGRFAVAFLCIAWPWAAWSFIAIPMLRSKRGRCVRCGYDLKDLPSSICPECGLPIPNKPSSLVTTPASDTTPGSATS